MHRPSEFKGDLITGFAFVSRNVQNHDSEIAGESEINHHDLMVSPATLHKELI